MTAYAVVVVFFLGVTLLTLAAIAGLLLVGIAFKVAWCKNVFRGGDYTLAALFGGDGKHSVSAYCGMAIRYGGALRYVGYCIDKVFGAGHCEGAAIREGLIPALGGDPVVQQGSANGSA